ADGRAGAGGLRGHLLPGAAAASRALSGIGAGVGVGDAEHLVHVVPRVVVVPDGLAQLLAALAGAVGAEVARGGRDRVVRAPDVLLAVAVAVHAVGLPGGGHELHRPERARARRAVVAAVSALHLADGGQDGPRQAGAAGGGLLVQLQVAAGPAGGDGGLLGLLPLAVPGVEHDDLGALAERPAHARLADLAFLAVQQHRHAPGQPEPAGELAADQRVDPGQAERRGGGQPQPGAAV